jgi:hypothetical protein
MYSDYNFSISCRKISNCGVRLQIHVSIAFVWMRYKLLQWRLKMYVFLLSEIPQILIIFLYS